VELDDHSMKGADRPASARAVPGHPANPLTIEALREKFRECAALVLPADRVDTWPRSSSRSMPALISGA